MTTEPTISTTEAVEEKLRFSIDSRLLQELGERLVARHSVALSELIKNAYDADATKVTIEFRNVTSPRGTIILCDNGNGMTLDDFRQKWVRIATPDATENPISPKYGRVRTGAKGIGRFASLSLSTDLTVQSTARRIDGQYEQLQAFFQWSNLTSGADLSGFEIPIRHSLLSGDHQTGVTLILADLRQTWSEEDFGSIQQDLLGLVSPAPPPDPSQETQETIKETVEVPISDTDPGFSIVLDVPEFPKYSGALIQNFYHGAWGVINGKVDDSGLPSYSIDVPITKEKIGPFSPSNVHFGHLADAGIEIRYFVYRTEFFKGLDFGIAQARRLGRAEGGVRIYLDGFRVFPYGDQGDDWLGLDSDRARNLTGTPAEFTQEARGLRRPMLHMPGNYQLFGYVTLSRNSNPFIIPNVSRERLVENVAYEELKKFVRLGIDWATIQYSRYIAKQESAAIKKTSPSEQLTQSIDKAIQLLDESDFPIDSQSRGEMKSALNIAKQALRSQQARQISELSMLRILASAGTMVMVLDHTLRAMVGGLGQIRSDLSTFSSKIAEPNRQTFQNLVARLEDWKDTVQEQASQVGLLIGSDSRDMRRRILLSPMVEALKSGFANYCEQYDIELSNNVPSTIRTSPMFSSEVHAILINLVTNSIKAVRDQKVRKIEVSAHRDENELRLWVKDSGIGLSEALREEVFEPFYTTSTPDPVLGVGTGLGLKIVKDLVNSYGGEVFFIDSSTPWSTTIEIRIAGK